MLVTSLQAFKQWFFPAIRQAQERETMGEIDVFINLKIFPKIILEQSLDNWLSGKE